MGKQRTGLPPEPSEKFDMPVLFHAVDDAGCKNNRHAIQHAKVTDEILTYAARNTRGRHNDGRQAPDRCLAVDASPRTGDIVRHLLADSTHRASHAIAAVPIRDQE
jgi:hypothetical protein